MKGLSVDVGALEGGSSVDFEARASELSKTAEGDEVLRGVLVAGAEGGFEGVFVADGEGVEAGLGAEACKLSLTSPYSFHSSTSSRS